MNGTIEQERLDLLRDRLRSWSDELLLRESATEIAESLPEKGRSFRFLIRVVINTICILSGLLLFGLFYVLELPHPEGFAGGACVTGAIACRRLLRWRHTGAEEGWMVVGVSMLSFVPFDGPPADGVWLLISIAITIAARLVRAPLFHGVAVLFFCGWIAAISSTQIALFAALGSAVVLAIVRGARFRSPYIEISLVWSQLGFALSAAIHHRDDPMSVAGALAGLIVLMMIGVRNRDTVTLWSVVPIVIAAGYEIGVLIPLPREWKLTLGGVAVMSTAILLERWLRTPRRGWMSASFGGGQSEIPELLGTIVITPSHTLESAREGGEFGGGGATEDF